MSTVKELINDIRKNRSQISASQKDEVLVMRAMLNDPDYRVDVYNNNGKCDEYCPFEDARNMISNVLSTAASLNKLEADKLADDYQFSKSDASTFVSLGKEFFNTYLETGRKVSFGGRENSCVSISSKEIEATIRRFPKKVGINNDGTDRYEKVEVSVPAYNSVKVYAPCPKWLK